MRHLYICKSLILVWPLLSKNIIYQYFEFVECTIKNFVVMHSHYSSFFHSLFLYDSKNKNRTGYLLVHIPFSGKCPFNKYVATDIYLLLFRSNRFSHFMSSLNNLDFQYSALKCRRNIHRFLLKIIHFYKCYIKKYFFAKRMEKGI